jgi:hypothetical protein
MLDKCGRRKRTATSQRKRRHARTRGATTIAIVVKINNRSSNFQARQQCLRLQLSPATHVCGVFSLCDEAKLDLGEGFQHLRVQALEFRRVRNKLGRIILSVCPETLA